MDASFRGVQTESGSKGVVLNHRNLGAFARYTHHATIFRAGGGRSRGFVSNGLRRESSL